jgi:PPP family 3-phenylpropionic acid transporter
MLTFATFRQRLSPFFRGSLFYAAYWGAVGIYHPFLFIYFADLGLSNAQIGVLASVYSVCMLLAAPLVARIADRFNQRAAALAICLVGYAALLVLMPQAKAFLPLVVLYLLLNIFNAPVGPVGDSLVVRMAVHHRLNFGGMRLWGSLIFAILSAVFGLVWERVGFAMMFGFSGGCMFLVAAVALLLSESNALEAQETLPLQPQAAGEPLSIWKDGKFLLLLGALFLIGATLAMAFTFESIYVTELGGTRALIGIMIGLSALAELPPMLFSQHLLNRLGDFYTLLLSFALLGAAYFGYALVTHIWFILLVNVFKGLGFGLLFIAAVVIIDRRAPAGLASTYQGLMSGAVFGLAPMIAGPLGGWIYDHFPPQNLFLIAGLLAVVAGLVLIPAFGKIKWYKSHSSGDRS